MPCILATNIETRMIKKYSLKALQLAINQALSLDETRAPKLEALQGKILEVVITPLDVGFFISFDQQQLLLLDVCDAKPDTVIHSNPLGLIRLSFLPASKARSLFNDKIRLSGDMELGLEVKKLFDELDIDWEGHLARFTGDVVAHQIGSVVNQAKAFKNQLTESLGTQIHEALHEEWRLFPGREEMNDFFQDVDGLSLDVERLEATINLLKSNHEIN